MYSGTYKIAGRILEIHSLYEDVQDLCRDYAFQGEPELIITTAPDEIACEQEKCRRENLLEGKPLHVFPEGYLETLAVYRKIAEFMVTKDTLLFHGSVIEVDGEAFLFTAASGTGKSTHTRLWRQLLGDRARMVNDDKPLLIFKDGQVLACGTPWDGKHHLSTNISVPLHGLCILKRGEKNQIRQLTCGEALPMLLQQSYHPTRPAEYLKALSLLDLLGKQVPLYEMKCTISLEAASMAYETMRRKER